MSYYQKIARDEEDNLLVSPVVAVAEDNSRKTSLLKLAAVLVVTVLLTILITGPQATMRIVGSGLSLFSVSSTASSSISDIKVEVTATSPGYGSLTSLHYLPWDTIVELHKDQVMRIDFTYFDGDGKRWSGSEDDFTFEWDIMGSTYTGQEITVFVDASHAGVYDCTVNIMSKDSSSSSSSVLYSQSFSMAAKYVRREIRTLTDDDRKAFFDALQVLYTTSAADGQQLYGSKYTDAEGLAYEHLAGAGRNDCDHWHDGAGFVVTHLAFTLKAEQALQAVNPAIALPYWEYSMDSHGDWQSASIFEEDAFGEATPRKGDHSVSTGFWGSIEVPSGTKYAEEWSIKDTGSLNPFANAYGDLRSPWNNNPSKSIGRHNLTYGVAKETIPTCGVMAACFDSSSLASMFDCLNGVTHGPVHILVGGAWGEGSTFDDGDLSFLQSINKVLFFKNLWRSGFSRCPTSCDRDTYTITDTVTDTVTDSVTDSVDSKDSTKTASTACQCSVPDTYIDTYGVEEILQRAGLWEELESHLEDKDESFKIKVLRAIEDPGVVGDMFSSGAAFDPMFWPVHGQIERVLGLKRAKSSLGLVETFDESWVYGDSSDKYLRGRCDWSAVASAEDLTLPSCEFSDSSICEGHGESNMISMGNFLNKGEYYTNREFYDFAHPWNEALPYTYDSFDFDYCASEGYSFKTAAELDEEEEEEEVDEEEKKRRTRR